MSLIIRAGLLIDGSGDTPKENVLIVVENGRIKEVIDDGKVLPESTPVVDYSSFTVMPGMIDTHTHLSYPAAMNLSNFRVETPPTLGVFYAAQSAHASLAGGFTTLRNMGGIEIVSLKRAVDAQLLPGPRMVVAGMVFMTGGHSDRLYPANYLRSATHSADGPEQVRQRVRQFLHAGVDFIKIEATGGLLAEGDTPDVWGYSKAEMAVAAEEAHHFGKRLAVHAHSAEGMLRALEVGADTIEHCTWADEEVLSVVAESGVYITVTCSILEDAIRLNRSSGQPTAMIDRLKEALDAKMQTLSAARKLGVKVALGTDACGRYVSHGSNAMELDLMRRAGFTPMECLLAGTKVAAEALGLGDLIGSLEPGKMADFIVLRYNPLEELSSLQEPRNVLQVYKEGQLLVDRLTGNRDATLCWPV